MTALVLPSVAPWRRHAERAPLTGVCSVVGERSRVPAWVLRSVLVGASLLALLLLPFALTPDDGYVSEGTGTPGVSSVLAVLTVPLLAYLVLWWALPSDRDAERAQALRASSAEVRGMPAATTSAAGPATRSADGPLALGRWMLLALIGAEGAVSATTLLVLPSIQLMTSSMFLVWSLAPALVLLGVGLPAFGLVLGLMPLQLLDQVRWAGRATRIPMTATIALAIALSALLLGLVGVIGILGGARALAAALLITLAAGVTAALLLVPWGRHLWRAVSDETQQRALIQQRSEFTAHLHDSVLQTLTLLQRPGTPPDDVRRLARSQERDLRRWLYREEAAGLESPTTLRDAVECLTAELEDLFGTDVHTVVVGDGPCDETARPLLGALREATYNACRHGQVDVDVFMDVSPARIEAFVRDRGPGFDLASVPEDRLGVRESIIGRMRRAGGTADVRGGPGAGTEVALTLPRTGGGAA